MCLPVAASSNGRCASAVCFWWWLCKVSLKPHQPPCATLTVVEAQTICPRLFVLFCLVVLCFFSHKENQCPPSRKTNPYFSILRLSPFHILKSHFPSAEPASVCFLAHSDATTSPLTISNTQLSSQDPTLSDCLIQLKQKKLPPFVTSANAALICIYLFFHVSMNNFIVQLSFQLTSGAPTSCLPAA